MTATRAEAGFSLVETLVALAVIAAMAGMAFQTMGSAAQAGATLAQRREAMLLAQSLLAQAGVRAAAARLADRGRWNDLVWRIERRAAPANARDSGPGLEAMRIEIADAATGRRLASVRTLRLAR